MTEFTGFANELKLLNDLLNPSKNEDSSDDEHVTKKSINNYMSPADVQADVAAQTQNEDEVAAIKPSPYEKTECEKFCEDDDEFMQKVDAITDRNSWKETPKWEVTYRQSVTASDVFLQMGNKTPSTASCENMIMTIQLPGETMQTIDLKVLTEELELVSAKFYLKIPLPQPVNPQLGNAKFDNDTESLVVTLVMQREFDFVNF